jgi:hypothetical protein
MEHHATENIASAVKRLRLRWGEKKLIDQQMAVTE